MSATDLVALSKNVVHAAAALAEAREAEIDATEELKRATANRNRCDVGLRNARAELDKALDS